jgi:lambda repressor-like predicted transcriptional regulator
MVRITGSYQGRNRFAAYEAKQLDEGWELTVKCYGNRIDETTLALSPWPVIERLIATALDTASKSGEAPQYDFNQKKPKVHEPARRRKRSPHGLVTTESKGEPLNVQSQD